MKILYVVLTIFLLIMASQPSLAQWEQISSPGSTLVYSMLVNGDKLYASSGTGTYLSTNSGVSWTRKDSLVWQFRSLLEYNGLIYGSYYYGILRSSNDGASWSYNLSSASIPESPVKLFEFRGNLYTSVQGGPGIYESTNGGTVWIPRGTGLPANPTIMSITSKDTTLFVIAQGASSRLVYRSIDGGANWVPLNLSASDHTIDQIAANKNAVVCHFSSIGISTLAIGISTDDGDTWTVNTDVGTQSNTATSFINVDDTLYYTTAGTTNVDTRVMKSTDNGGTFFLFTDGLPDFLSANFLEISASSSYYFLRGSGSGASLWRRWYHASLNVTAPSEGQLARAGDMLDIHWEPADLDYIQIELSTDSGRTFTIIALNVPGTSGQYTWSVPDSILSSKCMIRIQDVNNSNINAIGSVFKIKGYVLTRFKSNGDYEAFDPALHAWQFPNDSAHMWPKSWWSQFNYTGTDPYSGQNYPSIFISPRIDADSGNFIDWPLFVKTFSVVSCYEDASHTVYSPTALALWSFFKGTTFHGSCFGFSQSCLLAFDSPTQFLQAFPEVGTFQNIHDLPLTDNRRKVINQLYENQFGIQHILLRKQLSLIDIHQTLADVKAMLLSEIDDHPSLDMIVAGGGHSLVPYKLEPDPVNTGEYRLAVYDNNCPSGTCSGNITTKILIDSISGSWFYDPLGWSRSDGFGIYLREPASQYLVTPVLWNPNTGSNQSLAESERRTSAVITYLSLYNTSSSSITITDSGGKSIGYADSVLVNQLADGSPIIPDDATIHPPTGYLVPAGKYSIHFSGFVDSIASFGVLNQTGMFNFWRSDAENSQTDRLSYDNGIAVGNPDSQSKSINLQAITRLADGERDFEILNCSLTHNDSVKIMTPDSDRTMFVNLGPQKTVNLKIVLAGANASGEFTHASITVPANSTDYIVPNWQDLQHQQTKVYEDVGNTGSINDSILVTNQTTDVKDHHTQGIPHEFTLDQNYPNPFNPNTTISYQLPTSSHVTLKVFNVLGQVVATLVEEGEQAGYKSVEFNSTTLPSGLYFYRLTAGTFTETRKMLLLK